MKEIVREIKRLQRLVAGQIPLVDRQIDDIILQEVTNTKTIEGLLDTLLDYSQLGFGEAEFRRLNAYYATFQPRYARKYEEFYKEMNDNAS